MTRVTVTGATGLIGPRVIGALQAGGAEVSVLSRDGPRAAKRLAGAGVQPVQAFTWDLMSEAAPAEALEGRDAVVHLAGENIAQRWNDRSKQAIRESRVTGTRNLLAGLEQTNARPAALVSSSGVGYYGAHGEEPLDEEAPAGSDFLARICVDWESEASKASALGMRVAIVRTGVVLDKHGGALEKMLPPFRLGVGGPVAGGRQFISWIHRDDLAGLIATAARDERWSGPINATAPEPVTNRDFSRALGRALKRPAVLPVPGLALQVLYGEMAEIVTEGARVVPAKALVLGFQFAHADLAEALTSAIAG
ncbi:MAG TPA: TIGR01777 family oxidoreductase [Solirubrobacteraceae bacterium]|nr:TIGR01777 family oxidoreductase [Solirubrobacteraceae bacterium]